MPITQEDVRKTLSINLQNASRILDYRIMNEHDREIAGFALHKNSEVVIEISWKYFDPGFGFSYQILYIGQENPQMTLKGKILDVGIFDKVIKNRNEVRGIFTPAIMVYLIPLLLLLSILPSFKRELKKEFPTFKLPRVFFLIPLILLFFIFLIVYDFFSHTSSPPF